MGKLGVEPGAPAQSPHSTVLQAPPLLGDLGSSVMTPGEPPSTMGSRSADGPSPESY